MVTLVHTGEVSDMISEVLTLKLYCWIGDLQRIYVKRTSVAPNTRLLPCCTFAQLEVLRSAIKMMGQSYCCKSGRTFGRNIHITYTKTSDSSL